MHTNNINTYICLLYGSFRHRYVTCRDFKKKNNLPGNNSVMGSTVMLALQRGVFICFDGLVYNENCTAGDSVTN